MRTVLIMLFGFWAASLQNKIKPTSYRMNGRSAFCNKNNKYKVFNLLLNVIGKIYTLPMSMPKPVESKVMDVTASKTSTIIG